jgi:hypothetical protein
MILVRLNAKGVKSLPEQHDSAGQNDWKIQSMLFKRQAFFFSLCFPTNQKYIILEIIQGHNHTTIQQSIFGFKLYSTMKK